MITEILAALLILWVVLVLVSFLMRMRTVASVLRRIDEEEGDG